MKAERQKATSQQLDAGVIRPDELYHLEVLKLRLGWKEAALRTARRSGLQIKYAGGRGYVMGAEVIRHITETGKSTK